MSGRYVALGGPLFNNPTPARITAAELVAFATVCQRQFGDDPFKLVIEYDANSLSDRLVAKEVED